VCTRGHYANLKAPMHMRRYLPSIGRPKIFCSPLKRKSGTGPAFPQTGSSEFVPAIVSLPLKKLFPPSRVTGLQTHPRDFKDWFDSGEATCWMWLCEMESESPVGTIPDSLLPSLPNSGVPRGSTHSTHLTLHKFNCCTGGVDVKSFMDFTPQWFPDVIHPTVE